MADILQPTAGDARDATPPGARLAEARQAQNLSATDVARQLKLSVWQVEALEAGHYQRLPGPIFVRGFIRNYARIVKLDPEDVLRSAGESMPQAAARTETPPSHDIPFPTTQDARWPRYVAAAVVIFGALAVYEFVFNEPAAPVQQATVTPAPAAPAPAPKSEFRPMQTEAVAAPVAVTPEPMVQPAAQPAAQSKAEPTTQPTEQTAGQTAATSVVERPLKRGEKQVKLVFERESWVEIRDRNERVIFSQLNAPGTSQQVVGLPPLSIVVGNSQGVRMTFDDQPVDLASHTKIDVARLI
ncbi:MAG TPA: RodZ domain-containing protein, partial [Burkholderiales bacterium]|nr:RodZ domain-containing protein [Burkholderiales bacterium]